MIPGWTPTEVWSLVLLLAIFGSYFMFGRRFAAYLATRAVALVVTKSGDVVEVPARILDDKVVYAYGGIRREGAVPLQIRRLRRRLRKRPVVFIDGLTGHPIDFGELGELERKLWTDRIANMTKQLGAVALRRTKQGPFGELAPYIPIMMLMLLAMMAPVFYATGKAYGWW
jgi:hypothetical protein